jgi:hypothetical protein
LRIADIPLTGILFGWEVFFVTALFFSSMYTEAEPHVSVTLCDSATIKR